MADPADETAARFDEHKRQIERERQKAKDLKAKADAIEAQTNAQARRIDVGLPLTDACPDCWVERGETNIIVPRHHPDPNRFDRWGCPKCGWSFDVSISH
jgi:hypothetical protein